MCLINIIFGLIISGFSKNREDLKNLTIDIEQKCYICGVKRYEFDMKYFINNINFYFNINYFIILNIFIIFKEKILICYF